MSTTYTDLSKAKYALEVAVERAEGALKDAREAREAFENVRRLLDGLERSAVDRFDALAEQADPHYDAILEGRARAEARGY